MNLLRGPVRVSRDGVRVPRPPLRARRVGWDTVEAIAAPGRFDTMTTLLLTEGRELPLYGITREQTPAVAALDGKPVVKRSANV